MAGCKTSMIDTDTGVWSYVYNPSGNLTRQTDARGCVLTLSYDSLNRLVSRTFTGQYVHMDDHRVEKRHRAAVLQRMKYDLTRICPSL